jgi:hypothetical protein
MLNKNLDKLNKLRKKIGAKPVRTDNPVAISLLILSAEIELTKCKKKLSS